jgi:hypothetical protein
VSDGLPAYLRLELELEPPAGGKGDSDRAPSPARLRGALGKALVDAFCPFGEPRCDPKGKGRVSSPPPPGALCRLAAACPYGVLFATSLTRRPPFALYVPAAGGSPGAVTAEVTLYGPAWRHYAWLLSALDRALQQVTPRGLPGPHLAAVRRIRPERAAELLCGPDLAALPADLAPDLLGLTPEPFVAPRPVAVELLSPTHLLTRGEPLPRDRPVPFEVLVKSTLDRFAGLYGDAASPVLAPEVRAVVEAEAARVPLLEQDLRAAGDSHYSRRSKARLDLGGTVGRLVYGPQAAAFVHVLRAAEILHLGKNPTFGSGRLQVDLVS